MASTEGATVTPVVETATATAAATTTPTATAVVATATTEEVASAAPAIKVKDADAVKLFIGQVQINMAEDELLKFMEQCGPIFELNILKDRHTGKSKGCGFVTYCHKASALEAIEKFHNKMIFPGVKNHMQVKLSEDGNREEERKLFVGMLSKSHGDDDLKGLFAPYGTVEDVKILKHPDGQSRACGFVRFETREQAQAAVNGLNGSATMDGATAPLVVKFVDPERDRMAKKLRNSVQRPMYMNQGYQNQQNMYSYWGGDQQQQQQQQHQAGGNMGMMNQMGAYNYDPSQGGQLPFYAQQPSSAPAAPAKNGSGPDGANLFVMHLPNEWTDFDLYSRFAQFGNVLSSKVFVDKQTNQSKCFGFVSFDAAFAAQRAIQSMNGFQCGNKRLKVRLKDQRESSAARPY